jgi:hypothetical protein
MLNDELWLIKGKLLPLTRTFLPVFVEFFSTSRFCLGGMLLAEG